MGATTFTPVLSFILAMTAEATFLAALLVIVTLQREFTGEKFNVSREAARCRPPAQQVIFFSVHSYHVSCITPNEVPNCVKSLWALSLLLEFAAVFTPRCTDVARIIAVGVV